MNEKFSKVAYLALSLLIAVVFWLFVDSEQGNTITQEYLDIPIEFMGETDTLPSRGLMMLDEVDRTIDLTLKGPRTIISNLKKNDIRVQVELNSITAVGTYSLSYQLILPDEINRGEVITERASRSRVTVKVSELFSKTIPVQLEVVGTPGDNYIYMAQLTTMDPSTITVSGREEDVAPVDHAHLVLSLDGANATVHKEFSYELLDGDGNIIENEKIRVSDKQIEVVAPVYVMKTLPLTIKLKESPGSVQEYVDIKLEYASIDVAGEAASLENKEDILLGEIDLSAYQSDQELTLDVTLPSGCVNISNITSTKVSIDFKDFVETRAFTVTDISAIGLSDGQSFSRLSNSVDVLVRGPAAELEKITEENIRIVVDMTEYADEGTYSVPAIVLVDGSDQVGAVGGPYVVACKITS